MVLPRVIATDLDGTLLGRSGEVSERNRRALNDAVDAGVRVVIVTARPPRATAAIADLFDCAAVVCGNGAHAQMPDRDPLIRAIDRDTSGTLVDKLRGALPGVGFAVETGIGFYHDVDYRLEPWILPEWVSGVLDDTDSLLAAANPVTKLLARSTAMPVHLMHDAARDSVGPLAEVTYSGSAGLVEVSASGVNKGSTLALLCEEWGVSRDESWPSATCPTTGPRSPGRGPGTRWRAATRNCSTRSWDCWWPRPATRTAWGAWWNGCWRVEEPPAGSLRSALSAGATVGQLSTLRPTTPPTMAMRHNALGTLKPSPRKKAPMSAVPTTPTDTHTAYPVPNGMVRSA